MAIGAITMILANVGLQIYNNWCGSRQNEELQIKRQEFERAAKERNIEHMWKLLHEGQKLTKQLEEERHENRLDELKCEIDNLLQKLTYESTISNWPLKVLPLVMKNQAFGNLLANQEENVAMHVIFTRSNYDMFNSRVYPLVEKELEQFCDKYWSTISDHPIMFYSGAWKSQNSPTEVQVSSMRTALNNLPTLLITPFFRPNDGKLVFQIHLWGVGASSTDQFNIPEIEPTDFQRQFTNQDDYENTKGLLDEIIEDMVPYLQCLIGYMADTYFWSSSGLAPHLPLLVTNGSINTDGMKYLVSDSQNYYEKLLFERGRNNQVFSKEDLLNLLEGSIKLWDDVDAKRTMLENTFLSMCSKYSEYIKNNIETLDELNQAIRTHKLLSDEDFCYFLLIELIKVRNLGRRLSISSERIDDIYQSIYHIHKEQYEFIKVDSFDIKQVLIQAEYRKDQAIDSNCFVFIIWNSNIVIGTYVNDDYLPCVFSKGGTARYLIVSYRNLVGNENYCAQSQSLENSDLHGHWNGFFYCYNLNNKSLTKMNENNFEEQFGQSFERIGRGLGRIIDGLSSSNGRSNEDVWGNGSNDNENDSIEQLLSYFITNAGKTIPAERVENMTMQKVLSWVDDNVTPFADKVYIIRGINPEYQKHVFCVFFGAGEKLLLQDDTPRVCFITSQFNEEMKQTFNNNDICVIPLN